MCTHAGTQKITRKIQILVELTLSYSPLWSLLFHQNMTQFSKQGKIHPWFSVSFFKKSVGKVLKRNPRTGRKSQRPKSRWDQSWGRESSRDLQAQGTSTRCGHGRHPSSEQRPGPHAPGGQAQSMAMAHPTAAPPSSSVSPDLSFSNSSIHWKCLEAWLKPNSWVPPPIPNSEDLGRNPRCSKFPGAADTAVVWTTAWESGCSHRAHRDPGGQTCCPRAHLCLLFSFRTC